MGDNNCGEGLDKGLSAERIQAKDLRCKERTPLHEVIPLNTPFVVYIDPTNKCNFKCAFCPTSDEDLLREVGRPLSVMDFELFKKVVDDLKSFPQRLKLVSLYKDGEPLLNKNFPDMVRYLREANVTERIWTKTNGSVLRPSLNQKLVESGLDMICISIESVTQEGYQKIAKAKINYDGLIANIADLYSRRGSCQVYIKIADSGFSHDEIEKFYSDFSPYCDKIAVEKLMGWSYSDIKDFTLGTNPDTYDGLPLVDKMVCAYPFYVMAVNSDGSVSLCGNDWAHGTVVGNVNTQSLPDIWGGEALFLFRKKMLEGRRKDIAVCSNCYYLKIVPDNIDDYRGEILRKILSMKS